MKQQIVESKRMDIFFHPMHRMFEIELRHHFEEMNLFKEDMYHFLEMIRQWKPDRNLWDVHNFHIILDEAVQQWLDEHINKKELDEGIRLEAFVVNPTDLITELGVEQVMGEEFGSKIITRMFDNREKAFEWLVKY